MIDSKVETLEAPATNGDREPSLAGEAKATVAGARRRRVRPAADQGKRPGGLAASAARSNAMEILFIGPDAHVEADVKSARVTIAGFVKGNIIAVNRLKITNNRTPRGRRARGALVVLEGGVHHGVIRVHPREFRGQGHRRIENPRPAPVVTLKTAPNPVGRVRKVLG